MQLSSTSVQTTVANSAPVVMTERTARSGNELTGNAAFAPLEAPDSVSISAEGRRLLGGMADMESPIIPSRQEPAKQPASNTDNAEDNASEGNLSASTDTNAPVTESTEQSALQARQQEAQEQAELQMLRELKQRDQEVKAHEQAHASVGGSLASAPSYTYQKGPDGVRYAVGGEVQIDVSPVQGDPQATLEKMQLVQRAALAPAEPSTQDRQVAAQAAQQAAQAQAEIQQQQRAQASAEADARQQQRDELKAERDDARKRQEKADKKEEQDERVSAAERFAEFNNKLQRINETLLRISMPRPISAGELFDERV